MLAVEVLYKSDYKFQDGGQNGGRETIVLVVTQQCINIDTSFFHLVVHNDSAQQL